MKRGSFRLEKYSVLLSKTAVKQFKGVDNKTQKLVRKGLEELSKDPFSPRSGADIKQLRGSENPALYRLRIGSYRVIYCAMNKEVKVTEIMQRKKGYSFLE